MSFLELISNLQLDLVNFFCALVVLLIVFPLLFKKQFSKTGLPKTRYSSIKNLKNIKPSAKVKFRHIPFFIRMACIFTLAIAFSHPWVEKINPPDDKKDKKEDIQNPEDKKPERQKVQVPAEGISIQLVIDRSGSMGLFPMNNGLRINYVKYDNELMSKFDVVKIISKQFIAGNENQKSNNGFAGRWSDLIGLYTFARAPFIACPLTLRHDLLLNYISQLEVVRDRNEDGTYIGYALERVILQIIDTRSKAKESDAYNIKSSIIVLITDGEQAIRPEDSDDRHKSLLPTEVAKIAKENGVKIYSIVIKPQVIYDENGTAYSPNRIFQNADFSTDEVREAAELTGGKCYIAKDGNHLAEIYQEIDQLEKSKLPSKKEIEVHVEKENKINKKEVEKIELFLPFLWIAFILFLSELLISNFYFKRIP